MEIILVDDGSTDLSGRICDEYAAHDSRAKVIHQPNHGLWYARNVGQEASAGDFLMFPDGDDYFHKDIVRILYEAISLNPEYDIAIAKTKKVFRLDEEDVKDIEPSLLVERSEDLITGLLKSGKDEFYVYMWNKLYRRSLIQDIRSRNYARSQDFDVNFRIYTKTRQAVLIDNYLYYWYQHPGSLTKDPNSSGLMYQCRSRSLFNNLSNLTKDNLKVRCLLLRKLYKMMSFWQAWTVGRVSYTQVRKECKSYYVLTRKEYISCRDIPLLEKLVCLIAIYSPRLMHLWMKFTDNLPIVTGD